MLILIPFIYAREYYYNLKGYYSLSASEHDVLSFSLLNDERAYIFSSLNQYDSFIFPDSIDNNNIPTEFNAFSFDDSIFRLETKCSVNISIWIIEKNFCNSNSLFIMFSYRFSLQIKSRIDNNNKDKFFNYCIFSPSLLGEYRKVSFKQQKPLESSSFSKCNIYSMNVHAPDYQTEGEFIEAILSNSFFLKISIPANNISSNQVIESSFVNEKVQDNTFISSRANSFYSFTYFYTNNSFIKGNDWVDDIGFSFKNLELKKFSWVWIVFFLLIMIILLLLCLFVVYMVIKKRNGSSSESIHEDQEEECIPDAQNINQITGELNDAENNEKVETKNDRENIENEPIKQKSEKETTNKNQNDNPYSIHNLDDDINQEDSETIDLNVVEINPYSLPKA